MQEAHERLLKVQDRLYPYYQQFEKYRLHYVEVTGPYYVPVVCLLQVRGAGGAFAASCMLSTGCVLGSCRPVMGAGHWPDSLHGGRRPQEYSCRCQHRPAHTPAQLLLLHLRLCWGVQAACAVAVFCICMFKVDKFFRPSEVGFQHPPGWADLAPGLLTGSQEAHGRVAWQPASVIPPPHASCLLGLMDNGVCLCSLGIWTGIASLAVSGVLYFSLDECCACDVYYLNKAVQAGVAATGAVLWAAVGGVLLSYHRRASMAAVALQHWRLAVATIALGACGMFLLAGMGVAVSVWSSGWEAPENSMFDPARLGKMPLDWDPFDLERGREANREWFYEFMQFTERSPDKEEEERIERDGGGGRRDKSSDCSW